MHQTQTITKTRTKTVVAVALVALAVGGTVFGLTLLSKKTGQKLDENPYTKTASQTETDSQAETAGAPAVAEPINEDNGAGCECLPNEDSCACFDSGVEPTCSDSDSGLDYYVKGDLTYKNNKHGILAEPDSCADDKYLVEGVCDSPTEYTQNHKRYDCPNGCKDGACVK